MAILTVSARLFLFLGVLAVLLPLFPAVASVTLVENKIKAGLIYNFLKYTEWPNENAAVPLSQMVVCVYGEDPFNGDLQPMAERTVNQRDIRIRNIYTPEDATECHLLFVNSNESDKWPELREALKGRSILTVSDLANFASTGGMIEFNRKDDHINVELNLAAVEEAHLHVQDRILRLTHVTKRAGSRP